MSRRCLLLVLLLLLALGPLGAARAEDAAVGAVLKESPGAIGEVIVRLQDGHTVKRGDILVLRRDGQQTPLGEGFVLRLNGNDAVVSLKGMFDVKPGDGVFFGRRPAPVAAAPAPAPAATSDPEVLAELEQKLKELEESIPTPRRGRAADSSITPAVLKDPNGHYTLRVPPGWQLEPVAANPNLRMLVGADGEAFGVESRNSGNATRLFENPARAESFVNAMRESMAGKDVQVTGQGRVAMFGMNGLRLEITDGIGNSGYALYLPGNDHLLSIVLVAPTPEGVKHAETLLKKLQIR